MELNDIPIKLVIGRKYHTSWATNRGFVWILTKLEGSTAIMKTPRTNKIMKTHINYLRDINRYCGD